MSEKKVKPDDFTCLSDWLDHVFEHDLPDGIVAFSFNLYEGSKNTYDIQLIGSDEFDEDDSDWACSDYFTTDEDVCSIPRKAAIKSWETGLSYITDLVKKYLEEGKNAAVLKGVTAVGIGFVDGDIDIIYRK